MEVLLQLTCGSKLEGIRLPLRNLQICYFLAFFSAHPFGLYCFIFYFKADSMLILILSLTAILFFIWPIPHTVSIREVSLTVTLLLSMLYIYKKKISSPTYESLKLPIAFYFLFTAWILFVAMFISPDTHWAFRELKSQWLMGSLALVLGSSLGIIIRNNPKLLPSAMTVLFLALLIHVIAINMDGLSYIMLNGLDNLTYITRLTDGLTIGPIDASVLCDFLLVFGLAEWLYRKVHNNKIIPVPGDVLAIALTLALTGSVFCGLRNIVELAVLSLFAPALLFKDYRRKGVVVALSSVAVFLVVGVFFYKMDSRWSEIGKSVSLAATTDYDWDIAYKKPTIEPIKGLVVNTSNYLRFEKYKTSMGIIKAHYLGVGYGRNAFGHGIRARYDKASSLNADSSFLDLFIGTGLIGGFLWVCLYSSLFYAAYASFKDGADFPSCVLLLLLAAFGARMMVDSIFRDHLMQQFLFMVSFLIMTRQAIWVKKGSIHGTTL